MLKVLKELTGKGQAFPAFGAEEPDILRSRRSIQVSTCLLVYIRIHSTRSVILLLWLTRSDSVFSLVSAGLLKIFCVNFFMKYRNGTRKIDCILRVISSRFFSDENENNIAKQHERFVDIF